MSVYVNLTHKNSSIHGRDEHPQLSGVLSLPANACFYPARIQSSCKHFGRSMFFITMYWCPQANASF